MSKRDKEMAKRFPPMGFAPDGRCLIVPPGSPLPNLMPTILPDPDSDPDDDAEPDVSDLDDPIE